MSNTRVKISSIVQSQLPDFVREEYPLVSEFLKEYYNSLEGKGGTLDVLQNIDQYVKIDNLTESLFSRTVTIKPTSPQSYFSISGGFSINDLLVYKNGTKLEKNVDYFTVQTTAVTLTQQAVNEDILEFVIQSPSSTFLTSDVDFTDDTINVASTYGFPDSNGIIKIDSEIILYKDKTSTSFTNCTRGFSGITSYRSENRPDQLEFSTSEISTHSNNSKVENLSSLLLKEFLTKLKKQLVPGFEDREFADGLNQKNFIKQAKDFYKSKGTDDSYKVLFRALFGENVEVLKPRDFLLKPSDAKYRITRDIVAESISGDPLSLVNRTLYQDAQSDYQKAYGTITNVEKIQRSNKTYYVLSLDSDYDKDLNVSGTVYGSFSVHPSTRSTSKCSINNNILDVDSTIGFPVSGTLVYNVNGVEYKNLYITENSTQFNLIQPNTVEIPKGTDIRDDAYAYSVVGNDTVKVKITGVLSGAFYDQDNYLMSKGDKLKTVTLGYKAPNQLSNGWIFNIANKFNVKEIKGPNSINLTLNVFSYEFITYDPHTFYLGDTANLISSNGSTLPFKVIRINNENSLSVEGPKIDNLNLRYVLERDIIKPKFSNFSSINSYAANIQNVYIRNLEDIYVTSNSLPNYLNENINIKSTDIVVNGTFSGEVLDLSSGNPNNYHGLYSGDSITYIDSFDPSNTLGILPKTYYVEKIDNTKIKLSNSRFDLYNKKYISVGIATVTNNIFKKTKNQFLEFSPQRYIKNIAKSIPTNFDSISETPVGPIGIFVNGVEAFNYKSEDKVYNGGIENINIVDGGEDYDVINPPSISIKDDTGFGVEVYSQVSGSLERIDIIDGGFDYTEDPIVTITGGNGSGAFVKPNLTSIRHRVSFNSVESSGLVDLTNNTIGFSSYHKFRDFEKVVYLTEGQTSVGGITTNAQYFVNVQDSYKVKLHKSFNDAISGINTVDLTSYGVGVHVLESFNAKRTIASFSVLNGGSNYENKKTSCTPSGINTASNTVNIANHGYNSGELIKYTSLGSPIGGLTSNEQYYVVKVNDNQFQLTQVGIATTNKDFYYRTNQTLPLTSIGSSDHVFNYPDIVVSVKGKIGVSTVTGQDFNAIVQPIFRGSISGIFVKNPGVGYGSSENINYERQPNVVLGIGSQAQLTPIISNGQIKQVLVLNSGANYTASPTINVLGVGTAAILTPIINNGKITEVKVVSGGVGFNTNGTSLEVIPAGRNLKVECKIKSWTINKVEKNLDSNKILEDDGVIDTSSYTNVGLQYCHLYAPRKLRRTVFGIDYVNGKKVFVPDLTISGNREVSSKVHSPIIGWAYDGNPIYGPYGYSLPDGGTVREMVSGYVSLTTSGRPDPISSTGQKIYPEGFFIEDYQFNNSGDLDEHNGRFCITPEFPEGTYAYFATINNGSTETSGVFKNYKKPTFPYLIGNTFKSKPNELNYQSLNQFTFDFKTTNLLRNTTPYNLTSLNSQYDFLFNPIDIKEPSSKVKSISLSGISDIGITTGGNGYKIGDKVVFNNTNTSGSDAYAEVSYLVGKEVNTISFASTFAQDVEFYPINSTGKFIGFCSTPHNIINNDILIISGLSTSATGFDQLFQVGVRSDTIILSQPVGTSTATGIVTYFNVNGSLDFPYVRENDIFQLDNEKVKILSIDKLSSRVKVLREYDSTAGSSHTATTVLYEKTRKFTFDSPRSSNINYKFNREIYFNPSETISLGSSFGIGVGSTLYFSNPGAGITNIFVPTKTVYIPSHSLETGDELIYSSNGGSPIFVSNDGVSSFQLTDNQSIYVAKITNDLIGISTNKVGLGSTGQFVGIDSSITTSTLYFTNLGSGKNHSFKTNYSNVLTGEYTKNVVTVSTASTHGLKVNDVVYLDVLPGITTTVVVKYNDKNRRLVVNPRTFDSSDVDIINNTITIENHGYTTGEKVIYNASVNIGGLVNDEIYYVVRFNKDKIKLTSSYYNATKNIPEVLDFTSASTGSISAVNPRISIISNQVVDFDLSDSSLSYSKGSLSYPAFEFKLYTNENFTEEFNKSEDSTKFDVVSSGKIGVDSTSYVRLSTENLNSSLYYRLVPVDLVDNFISKKEIIIDSDNILDNNKLLLSQSTYYGFHNITGVGQTTFTFNIFDYPESISYTKSDGDFRYYTDSRNTTGEIKGVEIKSPGRYYDTSPGITSVFSENGRGAILDPITISIGKINRIEVEDIGFGYSSDTTLYPTAKLPQILKVNPLSIFKNIGVSSVGIDYTLSPNLVVIDSLTNSVVSDVDLQYDINTKTVTIVKNTEGLYNTSPRIIPTNNSNGIPISNVTYNSVTKDVTVEIGVNYSFGEIFPFNVGDRVLVEGVSVGSATTFKGYNSKNYDYALFTLKTVNPQYGGSGATIVYNISDYLTSTESPGIFDVENSAGTVVPEKYFPIFNPTLEKYKFNNGEKVTSGSSSGVVVNWNELTEELKISSVDQFEIDSLIEGESSKAKGTVISAEDFDAIYTIDSSALVKKGWINENGFLNNSFQVIPDNNYYQNFSYSIKSKVDYETWNESIGNLNHTSGFKKFGDLIIESVDSTSVGISTSQDNGDFSGLAEFISEVDLNCVNDFDLARERTLNIDSDYYSKEIILNSVSLQDEFQSIGNRVLSIDDISNQFSNLPSEQNYSNVDTFRLADFRSRKYITYVRDKRFTGVRQIYLVSLLHDNLEGYLNQYARSETLSDLGSFDFSIFGTEGTLEFYPLNYFYNNYDISVISYGIKDTSSGIGSTALGNLVDVRSSTTTVSAGTTAQTNIVGIGSTYLATKVLVQFSSTNGTYYQFDELTLLNDGTDVSILEYGRLSNASRVGYVGDGIGTYSAYISGSNINLDFTPNVGLGTTYVINTLRVSFAGTDVGITTGTISFDTSNIISSFVSISSSPSPSQTGISTYTKEYGSSYYIAVVEDTTNNEYQISELVVVDDETEAYLSEFGVVETSSGLGTFGVGVSTISGTTLNFTPNPDISVNVKVYQNSMRVVSTGNTFDSYGFTNASIDSDYGGFEGIFNSIKRSFDLYHKQTPIFERVFDASDSTLVDVTNNYVRIPKHFFVTGEELVYSPGNGSPIGIATTSIAGIGLTDQLPSSVFAIKLNDLNVRFASSAENALKAIPDPLIITSVGVGTTHFFTSKKQNTKCLISIDNYIQSPVVSTSTTTVLVKDAAFNVVELSLAGISSIFGGDLLKINNEIVKVNTVGYGSTNVFLVDRGWMGTEPETHSIGSTVTKITGNYNIIDNTIHFVEAPYGNSPIGTITNRPDDRDYTGITTRSTFNGRVFLRSGVEDSSEEPYNKNYIFDGLSEQFTGINTEFILKSSGSNVTGISTGGIVLLINNIFQEPQRLGSIDIVGNYKMYENAGITTLGFTGNISSTAYDVNTSSVPRGGVIVSVASTQGFGYQPLISAGGTSIVSVAGTISNISVGNSGSGYRSLEKYEIIAETSVSIGSGSTIIPITNERGVLSKLQYSSSNTVGISSILQNVPIVGFGNTYILIGSASTVSESIDSGTSVLITLDSPTSGLVDVGVKTASNGIVNYEFIGFATVSSGHISTNIIITNPGSGYTTSNPPVVVFDNPHSYDNIPLIYSSGYSGIGTQATINIVVGQGSSVVDFEIRNLGYAYKNSEVLTIPTGGLTGIPTDISKPFRNFELTIDQVFADLFSGWSVGDFQVIDKIENLFNGVRRNFPIKIDGVQTSIRARTGSNIDIQSVLLIFINDILQTPDEGYTFRGGSTFTFSEPPKEGDTCKILFYKGTGDVDVVFIDILETVKIGDDVRLNSDVLSLKEDDRLVTDIVASDLIQTNPYNGYGLSLDETLSRPLIWCRQTEDKIISGQEIGKNREIYEPSIQPTTNIIQSVGVAATEIFVQSVKIFFDDERENISDPNRAKIIITSQDVIVGASATAIVSTAGTISSVNLLSGGLGFSTDPTVIVGTPIGVGTTATIAASVTSGVVTSLTITNPGSGYTTSNPPQILIEYPSLKYEKIEDVSYEGDFGIIVGINTTSVGVASTAITFDLFVPTDSYLRDTNLTVGIATTGISGIKTDYYFTVFNSNIGMGVTSLDSSNNIVGVGTTCLDNVYQVASVSIAQTNVPGVGLTNVSRVTVSVLNYNGLSGMGYSNFYGEFSWGKINTPTRKIPQNFDSYNKSGISGLSTGAVIQRTNPLRYIGYTTTP
jgi:hypothetical protein